MRVPDASWSTAEVKRRLEEAALTLARLPDPDRRFRRRLTASWPAAPQTTPGEDFARGVERLRDAMPAERPSLASRRHRSRAPWSACTTASAGWPGSPTAGAASSSGARRPGLSTYRIRRALGFACHRSTIRRHANRGLTEIAAALNGERPPESRAR